MKNKIKGNTEQLVTEAIEKIQQLVQIPSVRNVDLATSQAPFGPDVRASLDLFLEFASELGFTTHVADSGKYGYAEIGPSDGELIGILGHMDVVSAGDEAQWIEAKPFSGDVVDNKIIGRGALDDKGPMVINLMAIKALMQSGVEFNKRIRFIVGTAEETTWECVKEYVQKEEIPVMGYTPDSKFPLINAEKTLLQFDAAIDEDADFTIESIGSYNAVCDKVIYNGPKAEEIAAELQKLNYKYEQNDSEVIVFGKSAHAKATYLGENAILRLCIALNNVGIHSTTTDFLANNIKETYYGEEIFGKLSDDVSGDMTVNVGFLKVEAGRQVIGFDFRIPVKVDEHAVKQQMIELMESNNLKYENEDFEGKLYEAEDGKLVKSLMEAYYEITNDLEAKPMSNGGATYARAIDNCVAFGMTFERQGMKELIHQPNECLEIEFIQPAMEIYATAILKLLNS